VSPREQRPDVLIVESLALFREIEAHYLSRVASVRTACNALSAAEEIRVRRPQLIVTALDLPDRPGEQFVHELRQRPRTKEIPIVALTRGTPGEHASAVRAGASDVLTRPLSHDSLVQSVQRFLAAPAGPSGLPRASVARPARLWDGEHSATGTLRNLSRGGCFVESKDWLPAEGHELHLDFGLPGFSRSIALTARLVWRRLLPGQKQRGAGFRFLELDGGTARALDHFVEAARTFGMGPGGPARGFA
jgi:CheY-like chemotaxis protein